MTREEETKKIAMRYAHDELKDNLAPVEKIVAAAFLNGIDYADHHPRWISVEDELPKGDGKYLGCVKDMTQDIVSYQSGRWLLCNRFDLTKVITHWMPLPTPPEHLADVSKMISGCSEIPNNQKGEQSNG